MANHYGTSFGAARSHRNRLIAFVVFVTLLIASNNGRAQAMDLGGKLQVTGSLAYFNNDVTASFDGSGEVEVFFPRSTPLEPRLVVHGSLTEDNADLGIKYLYLRQRIDRGHITMGRQPISWSYGAMVNLLDYGVGIEDLAGESITPGIDGLRYQRSLGSGGGATGRSLQLVASFPRLSDIALDALGYGGRLRFLGSGYDIGLVASYQPMQSQDNLLRAGLTYNGDLGNIGVYGGLGYVSLQQADRDDTLIQVGVDYSWMIGEFRDQSVLVQAEYLRFMLDRVDLGDLAGLLPGGGGSGLLGGRDLAIVSVSTQMDFFSSFGVALLTETDDWTIGVTPFYRNELGDGLEMQIHGSLGRDGVGDTIFGLSVGLHYYF